MSEFFTFLLSKLEPVTKHWKWVAVVVAATSVALPFVQSKKRPAPRECVTVMLHPGEGIDLATLSVSAPANPNDCRCDFYGGSWSLYAPFGALDCGIDFDPVNEPLPLRRSFALQLRINPGQTFAIQCADGRARRLIRIEAIEPKVGVLLSVYTEAAKKE